MQRPQLEDALLNVMMVASLNPLRNISNDCDGRESRTLCRQSLVRLPKLANRLIGFLRQRRGDDDHLAATAASRWTKTAFADSRRCRLQNETVGLSHLSPFRVADAAN
jgi:hypothetical protein